MRWWKTTAFNLSRQVDEAEGNLTPGTWVRVASSPDKAGMSQNGQMA